MSADTDSTPPRVRIGLAGLNNHGVTILRGILESETLELASVYDIDARALALTSAAQCVRAAESFEALAADPSLDALALVTPNHLHREQTLLAAAHGKHVFVEKPVANSVAEARDMITAMRDADRVLMVGHNTRRKRVFRAAAAMIGDGRIGRVVAAEGNLSRHVGLEPGLPAWKADPAKCVLLPMSQLGIHFIDLTRALFGDIERVSCIATARAMHGGAVDAVSSLLLTTSGIPVTLNAFYATPDAYLFRIYGTLGILTCTPTALRAELLEPEETIERDYSGEGYESFILQMREFGACIQNSGQPETGGEEGLQAFAVIEAMQRAAVEQRSVAIRDILG